MKLRLLRILHPTWQIAWKTTLITLPVTSFPLLSKVTGGTLVAPLAVIPLIWLCLTLVPFDILSKRPIPTETRPLYFFVLMAILTSVAAFFIDIPPYKGFTIIENILEAFITLGIGLVFFFSTIFLTRSISNLNTTMKYIHIGGFLLLSWSLIQLITIIIMHYRIPGWMQSIQSYISVTDLQASSTRFRIPGTTLEPSWLAHCLNLLYLPLWLAATVKGYSTFRFRILRLTVENLLLLGGIIVLIFTYSRIGLLAFGLTLVWLMLLGGRSLAHRFATHFHVANPKKERIMRVIISGLLLCILTITLGSTAYLLSENDSRFASFFEMESSDLTGQRSIFYIANQLDIAERVVYWDFGWKVFENHPILGVGLGNAGMFSLEYISSYASKLPEVNQVLFKFHVVPNTKCLWTRLLAETGLAGFSLFITWLIVLWSSARRLHKHPTLILRTLGIAGQFTLLAIIMEGFSIDTFALPYLWVALGLTSAAAFIGRKFMPSGNENSELASIRERQSTSN